MAPPNNRLMISVMSKLHRFWYRLTGGAVGAKIGKVPVLLITTTGRKSGKPRTTPIFYLADGDDAVVVASNTGDDHDPGWWSNLKSNPDATITIKREQRPVRAAKATPEEEARLWPLLTAMYPDYDEYKKRTTREIPVVILRTR